MSKAQEMLKELSEQLNVARNRDGAYYGEEWRKSYNLIGAIYDEVSRMESPYENALATYEASRKAEARADRTKGYDVYRDEVLTLEREEQIAKELQQGL